MQVNLLVFAQVKELVGQGRLTLALQEGATVADAFAQLCEHHPGLRAIQGSVKAAVNQEFAGFEAPLPVGCELAFFTPVGGG